MLHKDTSLSDTNSISNFSSRTTTARAAAVAGRVLWVTVALAASACFAIGVSGKAAEAGAPGWGEVFTVVSITVWMYLAFPFYGTVSDALSRLPAPRRLARGVRALSFTLFVVQQAAFALYLHHHVNPFAMLFLIPDVFLAFLSLRMKHTSLWAAFYLLNTCAKMWVLWAPLGEPEFNAKDNPYGPNGLKALLLLTIPLIEFPVLASRLQQGTDLFAAYTQHMAASFTHTLHVLDVLDMYLIGRDRSLYAQDVQYLLMLFALMGLIAANLYHVLLYFTAEDVAESAIRRLTDVGGLSAKGDGTKDERLLHYLLWLVFFVDLPFASVRLVSFLVLTSSQLSVFAAKNAMMMVTCVMLVINHAAS